MSHRSSRWTLAGCALLGASAAAAPSEAAIGGPDAFGYSYVDSAEPNGPVYEWVDVATTGEVLALTNDSSIQVDLGFVFRLYGEITTKVTVSANGLLYLGTGNASGNNSPLPTATFGGGLSEDAIAIWWDDWNPQNPTSGDVYFDVVGEAPDRRAVFQWESIRHNSVNSTVTFQAVLEEATGAIRFQYEGTGTGSIANGASGTIGLQRDPTLALSYSHNIASLAAGRVIEFTCSGADVDGDGFTVCDDCDDSDPNVRPDADIDCADGIDTDCDGVIEEGDADLDGISVCAGDCDDRQATVYPGGEELCDGLDNDCNTFPDDVEDGDGDGYDRCQEEGCDDDPSVFPTQHEGCDLVDNDCDGAVDEGFDVDADGYTSCGGDCDDTDATVNPSAIELCDFADNDCDGTPADFEYDQDGDGFIGCDTGEVDADCDDDDPDIFPGAEEVCGDGIDSDCGDDLDDEIDNDGDGVSECDDPPDCDDNDASRYPGNVEICDALHEDNDCNSATDEEEDVDQDGYDLCAGDCDDYDVNDYPGAEETCDGEDNDCNGDVDDGIDNDGDGYSGCNGVDCDDNRDSVYPGAPEYPYDGIDQDCSGADANDLDGDGYPGNPGTGTDCQDTNFDVNPGVAEVCDDGIDNDCDHAQDGGDADCQGGDDGGEGCSGCGSTHGGHASPGPAGALLAGALVLWQARRRPGTSSVPRVSRER